MIGRLTDWVESKVWRARRVFIERWSSLPRGRRTVLAWVVSLVTLGVIIGTWRLHHYVRADERFCTSSCHLMTLESEKWKASAHNQVRCDACHAMSYADDLRLIWVTVTRNPTQVGRHALVDRSRCGACHMSKQKEWIQITETAGHRVHVLSNTRIQCVDCHASSIHQFVPEKQVCGKCHAQIEVYEPGMEDLSCASCHNFLGAGITSLKPRPADCHRCHGNLKSDERMSRFVETRTAAPVSPSMIHGELPCKLCHKPHIKDAALRRTGKDCTRCHSVVPPNQVPNINPAHGECGLCHSAHSSKADLAHSCARCHELARPRVLATTANLHGSCSTCHKPHLFKASPTECITCHQRRYDEIRQDGPAAHAACGNCHDAHQPPPTGEICTTCHGPRTGHRHKDCTTCHNPHKGRSGLQPCQNCHSTQQAAVASGPASHRADCTSCHSPHAPGGASARCGGCHAAQGNLAASADPKAHQQCSSCHKPHAFSVPGIQAACSACHKLPQGGSHRGACQDCHKSHGPPGVGSNSCLRCHSSIPRDSGKHRECSSCHAPHAEAAQASRNCTQCHAGPAQAAAAWSAPQHKACPGCHRQHNVSVKTPCSQCHAAQAASAGKSKHTCQSCHNVHAAPTQWWGTCQSCHKGQTAAVQGRGPTHSQCQGCHKPHRFGKPTCQTCHNAMGDLGAHGSKGHRICGSCHHSHAKGLPDRNRCLSCHKDRTNHNPDAKLCWSCHLFK